MKKILILSKTIHPSKIVFFNNFNMHRKDKYTFKVIFTSETESIRKWNLNEEKNKIKFDYEILKSKQIVINSNNDKHYFHINSNIRETLDRENPDIVIHVGWAGLSTRTSLLRCKRHKSKYILRSESTKYERSRRRTLTKPLVKRLIRNSYKYLSFGTRSKEYLESLGAESQQIIELYNAIDTDYFIQKANELRSQKSLLKTKLHIKNKHILLFVGQLIRRKGIFELIEGYNLFKQKHPNIDLGLVFVGSGKEEDNMKEIIKEKNVKDVYFEGYQQTSEISEYFAIADIFTLPSHEEVWGLVINEAMCFGLPIITTKYVGASVDLIEEGKNGYIMKENTGDEFEKGMKFIFENDLIEKNNSLEIIEDFRVDKIVKGFNF